ncbi:hypothetical protein ACELLULO517_25810 [Acidisoma cellulosilytica]|uniref:Uncharacterized protein n=1 Tax=Acidisoma cellulosilyticum TaxID=2802395 RepID=A0A963Z899_9PROT|nr:hypothetical protein [Acidisoma cellulosilyticum]MCB8883692.1 hypothetical protein [Acidisoma cellulosilyticum]
MDVMYYNPAQLTGPDLIEKLSADHSCSRFFSRLGSTCYTALSQSEPERVLWLQEAAFRGSKLNQLYLHLSEYWRMKGRSASLPAETEFLEDIFSIFYMLQRLEDGKLEIQPIIHTVWSLSELFKPLSLARFSSEGQSDLWLPLPVARATLLIVFDLLLASLVRQLSHLVPGQVHISVERLGRYDGQITYTDPTIGPGDFMDSPIFSIANGLFSAFDGEQVVQPVPQEGTMFVARFSCTKARWIARSNARVIAAPGKPASVQPVP